MLGGWEFLPLADANLMIISSYGDVYPSDVAVAKKLVPHNSTDRLMLARQELDHLQHLYQQAENRHMMYCYSDHGAVQFNKDYYLEQMEKFLMECRNREAGNMLYAHLLVAIPLFAPIIAAFLRNYNILL